MLWIAFIQETPTCGGSSLLSTTFLPCGTSNSCLKAFRYFADSIEMRSIPVNGMHFRLIRDRRLNSMKDRQGVGMI